MLENLPTGACPPKPQASKRDPPFLRFLPYANFFFFGCHPIEKVKNEWVVPRRKHDEWKSPFDVEELWTCFPFIFPPLGASPSSSLSSSKSNSPLVLLTGVSFALRNLASKLFDLPS
jgi:hypothetical protein